MKIDLQPPLDSEAGVLRRLAELYAYDFSELTGRPIGDEGLYCTEARFEAMCAPGRHVFLIRADGALAGFAIVADKSYLTGTAGVRDVAEFFVLRAHRRKGIGELAARRMFELLPGKWEVRQLAPNRAAQAFWHRVVDRLTAGRFEERWRDDEKWRGPVQSFDWPASA